MIFKKYRKFLGVASLLSVAGCQTAQPQDNDQAANGALNHNHKQEFVESDLDQPESVSPEEERRFNAIVEDINQANHVDSTRLPSSNIELDKNPGEMPVEINRNVNRWLKFFTDRGRERFQRFLERGEQYKFNIQKVLSENSAPKELYYLALIESGFQNKARSRAAAVGVWQFVSATGRNYGLRVDRYVDERQDPIRSTGAAAHYLRDLYNVFQSWYLAMAAYNCGEGRIMRAIMQGNSRDFWQLARDGRLPNETMNYIPKFLAATIIGNNPEKFGFTVPRAESQIVRGIEAPSPASLVDISLTTGISLARIKYLNPHIRRGVTPPAKGNRYTLWVDEREDSDFESRLSEVKRAKVSEEPEQLTTANDRTKAYRVKRGERLADIAKKFRTTISSIKKINKLKQNRVRAGQVILVAQRS